MVSVPAGRTVVETVAMPVVEFTVPVPRVTPPLVKMTLPVGTLPVMPVTVAVRVTELFQVLGPEVVTPTVGLILVTVTVVAGEVAGLLFESPGVVAVIEFAPVGSEGRLRVATPPTMGAGVPSSVVPL